MKPPVSGCSRHPPRISGVIAISCLQAGAIPAWEKKKLAGEIGDFARFPSLEVTV
jgi:hypothetical protein